MRGTVDSIKERLDITDVISGYLKLEKTGQNFKGKCPFHNEKTASFFVSTARQTYYCFGCGVKGDMFSFIEEIEGVDFKGALKMLAEKAGVEVENYSGEEKHNYASIKTEKDKLYSSLEDATQFFENNLKNNSEAYEYLKSRGLNDDSIKKWRLGYASPEWRELSSYLKKVGYSIELLEKAGLVKKPEDSKKEAYDVFRGRIMFPLFDPSGKVIAFSGRALSPESVPKYLNTKETALFTKSETLYGFDKAKESIRKKNFTILVEGQMDLLMSHQANVTNTVASSGTAFTSLHLERLRRLSPRIILAFDGDEAGRKAAEKSSLLGLSMGMEVKIASIPEGKDPADLIKQSNDDWKKVLSQATHSIEYTLDHILKTEKDSRKIGRAINTKVLPLITLLDSAIEKSYFVSLISKRSGLREEVLWEDLKRTNRPLNVELDNKSETIEDTERILKSRRPRKSHIERRLIGIIFWQKSLPQPSIDVISLEGEVIKKIGEEDYKPLIENLALEKEALIFEAESYFDGEEKLSADIVELLDNLSNDLLHEELSSLIVELSKAEAEKEEEKVALLSAKIQDVHKQMRELELKRKVL